MCLPSWTYFPPPFPSHSSGLSQCTRFECPAETSFKNFLLNIVWENPMTHWKRLWYWEGLGAGGEGDDRGWDDWMTSLTRWTWVWVNSRSWWWTGRPGVLQFMGLQRVGHEWVTELTELNWWGNNIFIPEISRIWARIVQSSTENDSLFLSWRFEVH